MRPFEDIAAFFPEFAWPLASYIFFGCFFSMFALVPALGWAAWDLEHAKQHQLHLPFKAFAMGSPEKVRPRWLLGIAMAVFCTVAGYYGTSSGVFRSLVLPFGIMNLLIHTQMTFERSRGNQIATTRIVGICTVYQAFFLILVLNGLGEENPLALTCLVGAVAVIVGSWWTRLHALSRVNWDINAWAKHFLCPASLLKK